MRALGTIQYLDSCGKALARRLEPRRPVEFALLLLDLGHTVTATAEALGTYRRETARIGKRYLAGGLEHALGDDPRPKPPPILDSTQQAAIVAMVCGPRRRGAPAGQYDWWRWKLSSAASRQS